MSDDKKIESMMQEKRLFAPPAAGQAQAHIKSMADYEAQYKRSMEDPEGFLADRAKELLTWEKPWTKVLEADMHKPEIKWFQGGRFPDGDPGSYKKHSVGRPGTI